MSADFATMQINGRMTSDPREFEVGSTKKAVFSVAVNRRFKNKKTDEWDKRTTYIDCVAWGPQAGHIMSHGKKGAKVALSGDWETDRYTNGQGEEVKRSQVNARNVSIFTARGDSGNDAGDTAGDDEVPF